MRVLLAILVLAIAFGSYSAAASSFAGGACEPAHISHDDDVSGNQDDTGGAMQKTDICLDCHHCCAGHAVSVTAYMIEMPVEPAALKPLPDSHLVGEFFFSLLRPPRTPV